jgi:hypothetical protein
MNSITVERLGHVARIGLNRPAKRNDGVFRGRCGRAPPINDTWG